MKKFKMCIVSEYNNMISIVSTIFTVLMWCIFIGALVLGKMSFELIVVFLAIIILKPWFTEFCSERMTIKAVNGYVNLPELILKSLEKGDIPYQINVDGNEISEYSLGFHPKKTVPVDEVCVLMPSEGRIDNLVGTHIVGKRDGKDVYSSFIILQIKRKGR